MKPIIIYKELNEKGKIELTKKEFESYINMAYEQGYKDNGIYITPSISIKTSPGIVLNKVTCNDTRNMGIKVIG